MNKSQTTCPRFERPYALWCWGRQFTPPDICSAQTVREPPRKHVGIYIYIPNNTAGSVEMQPSLQATGDGGRRGRGARERERGRKSTHTVLFLLVCKQCSTHGLYVYSVCVFVCQGFVFCTLLSVVRTQLTDKQSVTTYRQIKTTAPVWLELLSPSSSRLSLRHSLQCNSGLRHVCRSMHG